jgi:hypothetical protein
MSEVNAPSRFNLMDVLIALTAITAVITVIMAGQNRQQKVARDVKRNAAVQQLQKALAFYADAKGTFPEAKGCITGDDAMTTALEGAKYLVRGAGLVDPEHPNDPEKCLYYEGGGTHFKIRYTLETSSGAGEPGTYWATP